MPEEYQDKKTVRLLLIDDAPDDVEHVLALFGNEGYHLVSQRVDEVRAAEAALSTGAWDAILCEATLPGLSPNQVLELARRLAPEAVFIVFARKIGDAELRAIMAQGAHDVIFKDRPARLLPAIERELRHQWAQREAAKTTGALARLEQRYRALIEGSLEPICYCHEGVHVDANRAYLAMLGYADATELKAIPFLNLLDKADHGRFKSYLRNPETYGGSREFTVVTRDGGALAVEIALTPISLAGEACVQIVASDISRRKSLESKLQQLHQRDVLTGLYNRHYFLQELGKAVDEAKAGRHGALLGIELHHLRHINDQLGHAACDRLLLVLARLLREHTRERLPLARVGGGQFALLVEGGQDEARALRAQLEEKLKTVRFSENGRSADCQFTLKHVDIDGAVEDRQKLLRAAYDRNAPPASSAPEPKTETGNGAKPDSPAPRAPVPTASAARSVPAASPAQAMPTKAAETAPATMPAAAGIEVAAQKMLETALAQNRVELLFQPVVSMLGEPRPLYTAQAYVVGPQRDWRPVVPLLAAAGGQGGLAGKIDRCAAQQAIEALSKLARQGRPAGLALQLSAAALLDQMLLPAIQQHLRTMGLAPGGLMVEFDAGLLRSHTEAMAAFARQAKRAGTMVAVNNFSYQLADLLTRVEVDWVSVNCARGGDAHYADARDAIGAAKAVQKITMATGVADHDTFSALWSFGVDYIQGDYLQPAQSEPDYDFGGEHTLASGEAAPHWLASA